MVSTRVLDGCINRLSNTEGDMCHPRIVLDFLSKGEFLSLYKAAKNYTHSLVRIS